MNYDDVFPTNIAQISFINNELAHKSKILEVGSATGNLAFGLEKKGHLVSGIEMDEAMVKIANSRKKNLQSVEFEILDLQLLASHFTKNSFDSIICVGNTLVHILDLEKIQEFFLSSYNLLQPGGKLILQIINYDCIFNNMLKGLPFIENEKIKFERYYDYQAHDRKVNFRTVLTVKSSGEKLHNTIPLLALRKSEIEKMVSKARFSQLDFYGNWQRSPFNKQSLPLILVATKLCDKIPDSA